MSTVTESVDVNVPVRTAYNQWTQFEEFPQFMSGVTEIRQLDATTTHWKTNIDGVKREFDAKITEQLPDERVAWTSTEGSQQAGVGSPQGEAFSRFGSYIGLSAFPGDRDAVLKSAQDLEAPDDVVARLESLPADTTYRNVAEAWWASEAG